MRFPHRPRRHWRALLAVTVAAALLVLAGCGDAGRRDTAPTDGNAAAAGKPRLAIVYYPQFRDGSWGEAALDGAQKLKDAGAIADFAMQENVNPGPTVRALRSFAEQGYNPIIAHSFDYGDDVKQVAAEFPNTIFAYAGGFGDVTAQRRRLLPAVLRGHLPGGHSRRRRDARGHGRRGRRVRHPGLPGDVQRLPRGRAARAAATPPARSWPSGTGRTCSGPRRRRSPRQTRAPPCSSAAGRARRSARSRPPPSGVASPTGTPVTCPGCPRQVLSSFTWNLDKVFAQMVADVAAGKVNRTRYFEVGMAQDGLDVADQPGVAGPDPRRGDGHLRGHGSPSHPQRGVHGPV